MIRIQKKDYKNCTKGLTAVLIFFIFNKGTLISAFIK